MTDVPESKSSGAENTDALARLIRTAGRRAQPPAGAYDRVLAAATAQWQLKVRRRKQRLWSSAAAASLALAVIAALFVSQAPHAPGTVAGRSDRVIGIVEIKPDTGSWQALRDETIDLLAQTRLRTRSGSRAGILLASGASLRIADETEIVLEGASRLRLLRGKVYLDAGADAVPSATPRLEVITAAGSATDVGTQFEVLYRDDAYRLRVREGRVRLQRQEATIDSAAGEQVTIDASGLIQRAVLAAGDRDWEWVQAIAPAPEVDAQPVSVLLAWVARETGKSIRFESPLAQQKAQTTILHGSIRHLAPLDALTVMLATTDLTHELRQDDTIMIRLKQY